MIEILGVCLDDEQYLQLMDAVKSNYTINAWNCMDEDDKISFIHEVIDI